MENVWGYVIFKERTHHSDNKMGEHKSYLLVVCTLTFRWQFLLAKFKSGTEVRYEFRNEINTD